MYRIMSTPVRVICAIAMAVTMSLHAIPIVPAAPVTALSADEPSNDRFSTAPPLAPGTHGGLLTHGIDTWDRYGVTLAADRWVEFRLTGPADTDFDLELYSAGVVDSETTSSAPPVDWFLVAASNTEATSSESIAYLVPPTGGGTYYIEVQTFFGSGAYTLSFTQESRSTVRLGGQNRYATSYAISRSSFTTAPAVVVASGAAFPDALAAAGLAGALRGPILLAPPAKTPDDPALKALLHEIVRLRATEVVVVGGTTAVNDVVYKQLEAGQFVTKIKRIPGGDRYETARKIAEETRSRAGGATSVFLVRGDDFADALAVAPYAYNKAIPVLLTKPAVLHDQARAFIEDRNIRDVVVAGGEAAVSSAVITTARTLNGRTTVVERRAGLNRYLTAADVARYCIDTRNWGSWDRFGIATGRNFPDALSGGSALGIRGGGALLLTEAAVLSPAAESVLKSKAGAGSMALVFGGTGAVSGAVMTSVRSLMP